MHTIDEDNRPVLAGEGTYTPELLLDAIVSFHQEAARTLSIAEDFEEGALEAACAFLFGEAGEELVD